MDLEEGPAPAWLEDALVGPHSSVCARPSLLISPSRLLLAMYEVGQGITTCSRKEIKWAAKIIEVREYLENILETWSGTRGVSRKCRGED